MIDRTEPFEDDPLLDLDALGEPEDEEEDEELGEPEDAEPETPPVDEEAEERAMAAKLIGKGYRIERGGQAPQEEEEPAPVAAREKPDKDFEPEEYEEWLLEQAEARIMEKQAPFIAPTLKAKIREGVIEAANDFGVELSPEAKAVMESQLNSLTVAQLNAIANSPIGFANVARDYHKQFPAKVERAPVGTSRAIAQSRPSDPGVQLTGEQAKNYKAWLSVFGQKDTKAARAEFLELS